MTEFGFTNPLLIDSDNTVLAGHGRLVAAMSLDMKTVPCVRIETMTPAQKRAYVIADNKLALNAGWDDEMLAEELKGLLADGEGFDVSLTGFSVAEVDTLGGTDRLRRGPATQDRPRPSPARRPDPDGARYDEAAQAQRSRVS